ncbi:fibrinogen-like protein 1 [Mantella aurantiaca]
MADYRLFGCVLIITFCFQGIASQGQNIQGFDCSNIWQRNNSAESGVYTIKPMGANAVFQVFCDMSETGGWTLIQKRNGLNKVYFNETWVNYESGFGILTGEHWLGLRKMYFLTHQKNRPCKLYIDLEGFSNDRAYAQYDIFSIGSSFTFYQLTVGNYSGTAGDSFKGNVRNRSNQYGSSFSTMDSPHDSCTPQCRIDDMMFMSCSHIVDSGWWFNACGWTNLNGMYQRPPDHTYQMSSISWPTWKYVESLKSTKMSVNCS